MKKITSISQQKKNKNRLNVFLDDEFAFGMDKYVFLSQRLKIGDEVDEKGFERLFFCPICEMVLTKRQHIFLLRPEVKKKSENT
jgi:regulatory protein